VPSRDAERSSRLAHAARVIDSRSAASSSRSRALVADIIERDHGVCWLCRRAGEIRYYECDQGYFAGDYFGLLPTTSEIRLLEEARRTELFAAVTAVISAHGAALTLPMRTRLCFARRI
jgi:hypothetical protein